MPKGIFLRRFGYRVAVIRPDDPELALAQARAAVGAVTRDAFEAILHQQPYTFIGLAGEGEQLLDRDRNIIGPIAVGDSMVPYEPLVARVPGAPRVRDVPDQP